tara:strand:+ start:2430 stop:2720 length:291 start_codon:yes stop_codon:yes gene_type:complete
MSNNIIICIPKVRRTISKKYIFNIFNKFNFGEIQRIDLVKKYDTQRAFIHYNYWNDNEKISQIKKWLIEGNDIKIIYDEPWYWKCSSAFRLQNKNI